MRRALALVLLALPSLARADAFVPPEGKDGVEVVIGLENAADYSQYTFVVYHDCSNVDGSEHTIISELEDDDGREHFDPEYDCGDLYLYAFPLDAFPLVDRALPPAAVAQLTDGPPSDPRVLRTHLDTKPRWWASSELDLRQIRDVYRVEIAGTALKLTPTRVIFDFGAGRELSKPFYKGKRPRIPRASEIPPEPPPEPAVAPSSEPAPSDTKPDPAPTAPSTPPPPAPAPSASPAPPPVAAASTPAPAEPSRIEKLLADVPPALLYGGGCLFVALGAGLALRRR
jgi:hypothetical protein